MIEIDRDVLAAVFASRVSLAKKTEGEALNDALDEHKRCLAWIKSCSEKEKSFIWFCDYFDLDYDAVRRAIQERR